MTASSRLHQCPSAFICGYYSPNYYANGKRIAVRRNGNLSYLFSDHLGGTSVVLDATTGLTSTTSYYPFARGGNPVECSRAGEHP